jgi:4-amino-4-deoxy-L-arabinose transferase-like glycosyltransferase
LVTVTVVGIVWALLVPPWQTPDENVHYAYAEGLAENFRLPQSNEPTLPPGSADELIAEEAVGSARGAFYPESVPPEWRSTIWTAYLAMERARPAPSRADRGGVNTVADYPPLYYLYAAIGYLFNHGGTAFGRLYTMRLWGILLLALNALAGWLLAGEILGRKRLPQLACGAVAGLLPMETFMGVSVNPDALMVPLWTLALWLGARVIIRRAPVRDVVAVCAVAAAAVLTKYTSYALLPAVAFAVLVGWLRRPPEQRPRALWQIALSSLAFLVPVLGWLGLATASGRGVINTVGTGPRGPAPFNVRQFLSYVWQFYLPRLPWMSRFRWTPGLGVWDVWVVEGIGRFGWLTVFMPEWVYQAAGVICGALGLAALWFVAKLRSRIALWLFGFLAIALIALLGGLHFIDYRAVINAQGPLLQGRYLLPVIGLLGLAVGLVVSRLPERIRPGACGAVLLLLLSLQALSMSAVIKAFYL